MARIEKVQLIDDLDGSEAEETVEFTLDGINYEIDLSAANVAELRDALAQYIASGRRVGGRKRAGMPKLSAVPSPPATPTQSREQNQAIREWARANGYDLSDRGRIPGHVTEAYVASGA